MQRCRFQYGDPRSGHKRAFMSSAHYKTAVIIIVWTYAGGAVCDVRAVARYMQSSSLYFPLMITSSAAIFLQHSRLAAALQKNSSQNYPVRRHHRSNTHRAETTAGMCSTIQHTSSSYISAKKAQTHTHTHGRDDSVDETWPRMHHRTRVEHVHDCTRSHRAPVVRHTERLRMHTYIAI
jgi:hypothetical protein